MSDENTQDTQEEVHHKDAYAVKDADGHLWMDAFIGTVGTKIYSNGVNHLTADELGMALPVHAEELGLAALNVQGGVYLRFPGNAADNEIISHAVLALEGYRSRMVNTFSVVTEEQFESIAMDDYANLDEAAGLVRLMQDSIGELVVDEAGKVLPVEIRATMFMHLNKMSEDIAKAVRTHELSLGIKVIGAESMDLHLYLVIGNPIADVAGNDDDYYGTIDDVDELVYPDDEDMACVANSNAYESSSDSSSSSSCSSSSSGD